jgi:hypothetical protein
MTPLTSAAAAALALVLATSASAQGPRPNDDSDFLKAAGQTGQSEVTLSGIAR